MVAPKVKVEIAFDEDFLAQDIDQETLQQLVSQVNALVASGAITSTGVYDLDGLQLDIDPVELADQLGESTTHRWLH